MGKMFWMAISMFFFSLLFHYTPASSQGLKSLNQGSSLSVERKNDYLLSPNGTFSCGFYQVGINAYCFSIWFTNSAHKTVIWMANRDRPANGKRSKLNLNRAGNLILTDADGSTVWATNTYSQVPIQARLLETGNLVLLNTTGDIIWQSFDSPTNTLLPSQMFTKSMMLVSMRGRNMYSSGYYRFHFRDDNVLVLFYNSPQISSVYWPNPELTVFKNKRTSYNSTREAILDEMGSFLSSDDLKFKAADLGLGPKRRLTLDSDGILRLYSLDYHTGLWSISWSAILETCRVHGLCGANAICHYTPEPACACPPGFSMTDPSDWSKGCLPSFNLTCHPSESEFVVLYNTDYYGYELETANNVSFEACRNTCLNDCRCLGFAYSILGDGRCFPKGALLNGFQMPTANKSMHIKVPKHAASHGNFINFNASELSCSGMRIVPGNQVSGLDQGNNGYLKYLGGFVSVIGIVEIVCISLAWWYTHQTNKNLKAVDMGYLAVAMGFRRFSYEELKTATKNFHKEIGRGGFGTVYKGVLDDGRFVAVKRLEGILQGEEEFWAEVRIIGRINHMNLVNMLGFCAEGKQRLLVYEYMEKGSLDKILFSDYSGQLDWTKRFDIALGTAKGLSYLHEECLEWVLHCDVKPQNILLDECFQPKVTDFGMSKLAQKNGQHSGFSKVKGTRGYLAPEWMRNLHIDAKADIYSYGIVLLELLSGRCVTSFNLVQHEENECNGLVDWVKVKLNTAEGMKEVVDPQLNGEYSIKKVKKLVTVALLCVHEDRHKRPAMSKVVELLLSTDDDDSHNDDDGYNSIGDE